MRSEGSSSRASPHAPLDGAVLRVFGLLTGAVTAVFLVAAVTLKEPLVALRAGLPFGLFCFATWQIVRRRPLPMTTLMATAVLVAGQVAVFGYEDKETAALVGLALIGIVGSLFAFRRSPAQNLLFLLAYSLFLAGTVLLWHRSEWPSSDVVLSGFSTTAAFVFGSLVVRRVDASTYVSEQRYRNLFTFSPVAMWEEDFTAVHRWVQDLRSQGVTDVRAYLTGNPVEVLRVARMIEVKAVNDAAVALLEADDASQLLGSIPDGEEQAFRAAVIEQAAAVAEGVDRLRLEIEGRTLLGRPLHLVLSWTVPRTTDGRDLSNVVVTIADVTREREHARQLQALVESKDRFVASVSHELRTPMTAVVGLSSELRDNWAAFERDEIADLLTLLAEQSAEVADIVEDLLVAARADIGKVTMRPARTDLRAEIDDVLRTLRATERVPVTGQGVKAWADPTRVRQILRNLVTNAFRYGGERVEIAVWAEASHTKVVVRDNGPGVPRDQRAEIFQPYRSIHSSSGQPGSVGLGLSVSRALARLMNGELTYRYIDGHSLFELTLPASD